MQGKSEMMTQEFLDDATAVTDAYRIWIEGEGLHPDTLLSELTGSTVIFLSKVTVKELGAAIELASCYADLCE